MLEVKTYNRVQLQQLIASDWFASTAVLPISVIRAQSHLHNPRARQDDVLLTIVFEGSVMRGYLGTLPDDAFHNEQCVHFAWLSCLWVDETMRGKGIARQLLQTVHDAYQGCLMVTEFTPEAEALYARSGFFPAPDKRAGLRAFIRFNTHQLLPRKYPTLKCFTGLFKFLDVSLNTLWQPRLRMVKHPVAQWQEWHSFHQLASDFFTGFRKKSLTQRIPEQLQWIINFPWLKEAASDEDSKRYYFSSVATQFRQRIFVLQQEKQPVALLMLMLRDGHLRVPYFYGNARLDQEALAFLFQFMVDNKAHTLTLYHPELQRAAQQMTALPWLHRRFVYRGYLMSTTMTAQVGEVANHFFYDGDGDAAFT
ncbi:MAG: GNAT family N-acetyltransferase [Chitinophagales bacterium]